jgi:formylglycine-generating enzyme
VETKKITLAEIAFRTGFNSPDYFANCKTKPVGGKEPNELGLYDISGNVRGWWWNWQESGGTNDPQGRVWIGDYFYCESSFRGNYEANGKGPDRGFRVCRGK